MARIVVGLVFVVSGWGKLQHLDKVTAFFTGLGIPLAGIQAPFVALVELIGGALLLVGAFTQLASLPLIGVMVVAIITAKRDDISGFTDLFGLSEFLYIVLFIYLAVLGAGKCSVDALLRK